MDISYKILTDHGFNVEMGLEYTGSNENFLFLLQKYYRSAEKTADMISDCLVEHDMESYTRAVHSLKSNSKMIGAMTFAGLAEELEGLGRKGDYTGMLLKTPKLIDGLHEIEKIITPYGEMEAVHPVGELSGTEARTVGEECLQKLEDLDDTGAAELVRKLMGYPFRQTQNEMCKEALERIGEFDYDEAAELIRKVLKEVEV